MWISPTLSIPAAGASVVTKSYRWGPKHSVVAPLEDGVQDKKSNALHEALFRLYAQQQRARRKGEDPYKMTDQLAAERQILALLRANPAANRRRYIYGWRRAMKYFLGYVVYLVLLTSLALNAAIGTIPQVSQSVGNWENIFIGNELQVLYTQIGVTGDFWTYMTGPFVSGYWSTLPISSTDANPQYSAGVVLDQQVMVGAVSLRQVRVKNTTCPSVPVYAKSIGGTNTVCAQPYSRLTEDRSPFGPGGKYTWSARASSLWFSTGYVAT